MLLLKVLKKLKLILKKLKRTLAHQFINNKNYKK